VEGVVVAGMARMATSTQKRISKRIAGYITKKDM
jgi:ribosomal protein S17E